MLFRGFRGVFFNPIFPTHIFSQSRLPQGYFRIPNQFAILNSRISPSFCFKILDPGLQIRQIPNDKKPLWGALCSWLVNNAANSSHNSLKTLLVLTQTHSPLWSSNLYTEQLNFQKFVCPFSVINSLILMLQQTNYEFLTGLSGNDKFAACLLDPYAIECRNYLMRNSVIVRKCFHLSVFFILTNVPPPPLKAKSWVGSTASCY